MSTDSLPEINDTSLPSLEKDSKIANSAVTNDYGTPNLLFLYYIPFPPDSSNNTFAALIDDIQSWHAWELQQAERQVINQIEAGNLPTDDAITSRIQRTNYRAKVIGVLREDRLIEEWLDLIIDDGSQSLALVDKEKANGVIRELLRSHLVTKDGLPAQLLVVLNIISGIIATDPKADQRYLLSHASLKFDTVQGVFVTEIKSSSFAVTQKHKGESTTEIAISFIDKTFRFNHSLWRRRRPEVEDIIETGEKIRKEMSLQFLVDFPTH